MKKPVLYGAIAAVSVCFSHPALSELASTEIPKESIERKVERVDARLDYLFKEVGKRVAPNRVVLLPTDDGITVLTDGSGIVGISVADLRAYGNGTELKVDAVNMLGVDLTNVKFTIFIFDEDLTKGEIGKVLAEQSFTFSELKAGTEHTEAVRIPKVEPSKIISLQIDYAWTGGFRYKTNK